MNECMLDRQTAGCVVEKIVLPQIVSIKQASEIMKLPPYYLRRIPVRGEVVHQSWKTGRLL